MAYESLKGVIRAAIQENGAGAITGDLLQGVLLAVVNALGGDITQNSSNITTLQGQVAWLEPLVVSGTLQPSGTPGQFDFTPDEGEPDYADVFDAIMANRVVMLYGTYTYGGQTNELQEIVLAADENQVRTHSITW